MPEKMPCFLIDVPIRNLIKFYWKEGIHRILKLIDFFVEMEESMRRLKKYLVGSGETKRQSCSFQSRIISGTEYCHFLLPFDRAN